MVVRRSFGFIKPTVETVGYVSELFLFRDHAKSHVKYFHVDVKQIFIWLDKYRPETSDHYPNGVNYIIKMKIGISPITNGFNRRSNWFFRSGLMVSTIYQGSVIELNDLMGKPLKWLCGGRLGSLNPRLKPWAMVTGCLWFRDHPKIPWEFLPCWCQTIFLYG